MMMRRGTPRSRGADARLRAAQRRRAAQQAAQAASVDPSIYYDGVYDKISTATRSASSPPPTKNSSKNLGSGTPRIGAWTKLTNRDPPTHGRLGFYSAHVVVYQDSPIFLHFAKNLSLPQPFRCDHRISDSNLSDGSRITLDFLSVARLRLHLVRARTGRFRQGGVRRQVGRESG